MGNGPTHDERHETAEELLARIEAEHGPEVAAIARRAIDNPDAVAAAQRRKMGARRRVAGTKANGADHAIPLAGPGERHTHGRTGSDHPLDDIDDYGPRL